MEADVQRAVAEVRSSALRAVVDTNVWVSGLISPDGTPGRLLAAIHDGRIDAVVSWALAREIVEVLGRPGNRRYGVTEADIDDVLAVLGPMLPGVDVTVELRDPDDVPVVAASLAGRADMIVTGDRDLLDDEDLVAWLAVRGVRVMTPAAALAVIGR